MDEGARDGPSLRILVVDDEHQILHLLRILLERAGHRTRVTCNAIEALEWFREDPRAFDLLLTDLLMPAMDGEVLAEACRALRPELPVILHTGSRHRVVAVDRYQVVLEKPATGRQLREAVAWIAAHLGREAAGDGRAPGRGLTAPR